MARIFYLDGWRGLAIILVIFGHFVSTKGINSARLGVEFFFVLSGRLMADILFIKMPDLPEFYFRRFSRVYPALFAFCVIVFWAFHGQINSLQLLSAVTLTANYSMFWIGLPVVFNHLWSLCIEEHMYVLLGLIAFMHRSYKLPVLPTLVALAVVFTAIGAIQTWNGLDYYQVYWRTDVRGASILWGAIGYLAIRELKFEGNWWLPVVFGVVGVLANYHRIPDPFKYSVGTICLAISMVTMPMALPKLGVFLENPLILKAGLFSYSLYLWQQPFYVLKDAGSNTAWMLVMAVLCAVISFYCVERPARTVLNRQVPRIRGQF
jgi:peptidoglycan/LPS O-acetylase OafA/YrhL